MTAARPYAEKIETLFKTAVSRISPAELRHPLLEKRPTKRVALVIFSSDRGLCGSYNTNILKLGLAQARHWQEQGVEPRMLLIGLKATQFFKSVGLPVITHYTHLPATPTFGVAQEIVDHLTCEFETKAVDKVVLVFTRFVNMLTYKPSLLELLPVEAPAAAADHRHASYLFEPSAEAVISAVLPKYLEMQVYRAFLEANASELAARMTAMSAATKNASEMVQALTLVYNKARQSSITQEILEVVSGAEALRG